MSIIGSKVTLVGHTTAHKPGEPTKLLKTLLHQVHAVKGIVDPKVRLVDDPNRPNGFEFNMTRRPRRRSRGFGSPCRLPRVIYDSPSPSRRFEFVPLWGVLVA